MQFVYILECSDETLYVGHTADLEARLKAHSEGTASDYTGARRPVRLLYHECHGTLGAAVERERQLKRWSAKKKRALVAGDIQRLRSESRRRG